MSVQEKELSPGVSETLERAPPGTKYYHKPLYFFQVQGAFLLPCLLYYKHLTMGIFTLKKEVGVGSDTTEPTHSHAHTSSSRKRMREQTIYDRCVVTSLSVLLEVFRCYCDQCTVRIYIEQNEIALGDLCPKL